MEGQSLLQLLNEFSDLEKVLRIVAYILRAVNILRRKAKPLERITHEEYLQAEFTVIKLVQDSFFTGIQDSRLRKFHVFQDESGLMRYWILHPRRTIRTVIIKCAKCRRFRSQPVQVVEGPLPNDRILVGSAFQVTSVDMAGPLEMKGKRKVWIAIFTCATYRGIHLELCSSLSTETFIFALKRFVARRGRLNVIYSGNGLNFVGCSNLLKKIDWKKITNYADIERINWKFNPPTAACWGGFWERMLGVVKQMLRSVLGSSRVTTEELPTLLCDVESVVNNRPLTYVDEHEELTPLTPNMFINNCGTSFIPDVDSVERDLLIRRYQNMQHCRVELRNRFRKEYLSMLVHNGQLKKSRTVKVGDVVLVGNDMQKRLNWPMGLIVKVLPGKDGHVRLVKVKTASGIFLRPVQRLYPLELSSNEIN